MGLANRFKSLMSVFQWSQRNPPPKLGASFFIPIYSNAKTFNDINLLKDYCEVPEVSGIISLKAKAFSKMIVRQVSRETGQDQKNYEQNIKVLRNPNWFQSWKEFVIQTKTFREIWGNEYLYNSFPFGFSPLSSKAMFTLPPDLMTTKTTDENPFYMHLDPTIEYSFQWGNNKYPIAKESIIHLNDNRVNMTKENWVDGQSWLAYQRAAINNIRSAYEARGFLIENRGAQGILSPANKDGLGSFIPMDDKEKDNLRKELAEYAHEKGKVPWIVTGQPLTWQQTSIDNPANLGLFEEVREDFYKLCDAAGTPSELFGTSKGTTFENQKWAERRLYENTIIPEAEEWIGALNSFFGTAGKSWEIVGSFSHLNVFQENLKERAQSVNMITTALHNALMDNAINIEDYRDELRRMGLVVSATNAIKTPAAT